MFLSTTEDEKVQQEDEKELDAVAATTCVCLAGTKDEETFVPICLKPRPKPSLLAHSLAAVVAISRLLSSSLFSLLLLKSMRLSQERCGGRDEEMKMKR